MITQNAISATRIEYLDFAKGVGITLVIFAHTMSSQVPFLYSFLMPVFFFVTGYFFRRKPISEIFIDKFNRLYIPFIFFFTCSWLFYLMPLLLKGDSAATTAHVFNISNVLIGEEENGGNVPIWFLVCNFTICILYGTLILYVRNTAVQTLICILAGLAGNYMYWNHIVLPWKIDPALSSMFFLHIGYLAAKFNWIEKAGRIKNGLLIILILLCLGISYYFSMLNLQTSGINKVNIIHNIVGDYLPFTLTGIFVLFWFIMSCFKLYSFAPVITFYGRNSMVILGTHYSIMLLIKNALRPHVDVTTLPFNLALTIFLMIISLPLISLAKRFVPQFTGYDKLFKPSRNAGVQA